ncbi:rhamnose mutarotase [Wolfiporia cocos MD-104 SS10]|uniref:Rhamnose mutarotase n=1 Tax=Wolfiporia cocos (strain MD-104) TaxID=742152 RepID=A0A2H3J9L2_WOLCO|nr:rhamnose mutarotase [Wolfiporia cocos MD-104 SS10]
MSIPHTKRVCQIIKLKPEAEAEYKALHAAAWPGVLAALARHHIADYSIHYYPPMRLLIAHFKYTGTDFERDMEEMAQDEETRRWWKVTDGMQESFVEGAEGSGGNGPWWLDLEEVFRFEGSAGLP